MTGPRAERFVVANLRLLGVSFAVVGILFIATPDGVLDVLDDLGDSLGTFANAPPSSEKLWLALGFAYMMVITGICVVVSLDVVAAQLQPSEAGDVQDLVAVDHAPDSRSGRGWQRRSGLGCPRR